MLRLLLIAGLTSMGLAGSGAGLSVAASTSRTVASPATVASVTKAFATRGVALQVQQSAKRGSGMSVLVNGGRVSSQGLVTVIVLRSAAAAKALPLLQTPFTECGGFSASYLTWRSRNVVATLSGCAASRFGTHLATAPVTSRVMRAMTDLAH